MPKTETRVILNILYSCKPIAVKFNNLMTLAIKRVHNLPLHLSYVSTVPGIIITQTPKIYVVFLWIVWVATKRTNLAYKGLWKELVVWLDHNYGRPLSVSGRPCYILPMFLFIYLFFYGRLILRPWLTEVRENFTHGRSWVSLEKLGLGFFPGHP